MKIRLPSLLALAIIAPAFVWTFSPLLYAWLDHREYRQNHGRAVVATGPVAGEFVALGTPEIIDGRFAVVTFIQKEQANNLRSSGNYRGKRVAFVTLADAIRDGDRLEISTTRFAGVGENPTAIIYIAKRIDPPRKT